MSGTSPVNPSINAADVSRTTNAMQHLTLDSQSTPSGPLFTNSQRLRMCNPPRFNGKRTWQDVLHVFLHGWCCIRLGSTLS